ncbi:MAG: transglutaminase-like domain-containing protein [Clostridia bacterium]|nr:transglutaminase-like domain-containing protein [Clostridia bacterium]
MFFIRRTGIVLLICVYILLNLTNTAVLASDDKVAVNLNSLKKGLVKISCTSSGNKRIKVIIQKDGHKYTYDLKNDGSYESFPLQMGNGGYRVSILKNVKENKYAFLKTEFLSLELNNENAVFLNSIQNISWDKDCKVAKAASELTKGLKDDECKIKALYAYIVDNFDYDYDKMKKVKEGYVPDLNVFMRTRRGICYDFSSLFAAMSRSVGIPAKLIKGNAKSVTGYHSWNEVYIKGRWVIVDTATDAQLKEGKDLFLAEKSPEEYIKDKEY